MSLARENRTYRVQQVPAHLRVDQVANFLATASRSVGSAENIKVYSVATSLGFTSFIRRAAKTATVTFKQTPPIFDNDEEQWSVPSDHDKWNRNLIFDTHFRGFTALNDVPTGERQLDCIAISGLASHPFGSWKQRDSNSNFMWLRDQLPMDLPFVRSIIYGYDTRLINSQSFKDINDLAFALIEDLRTIRKSMNSDVIFLAHSLGGIVLKQAVVNIANSGSGEDQLLSRVRMICFFGVPNQGMHNEYLLAMVKGQPNQELVESLSSGAEYLPELDIQFSGLAVFRTIHFVSVYETKKSLTTREVEPGKWIRSKPHQILVNRSSAIQRGTLQLDSIPVDEDHSNLVKFAENDQAYQNICARIEEVQSLRLAAGAIHPDTTAPAKAVASREYDLECLLESLRLADTNKRQAEIERAYANTFDWVYENPELKLISWLRGDGGIFWIRGKPGSGKSTLMKYLHDSEETSTCTKPWPNERKVICCWFFFYARGSFIQKSFEGLLHSILHQVLLEEPRLAGMILHLYLNRSRTEALRGANVSQRAIWPFENLVAAFDIILQQNVFPLRLYLFLDALDEYEGRPKLVADFLKSITIPRQASLTQMKVCFSSRPWNVFISSFNTCPGFSIHQYTKQDMRIYTESQLSAQYAAQTDSDAADIPEHCVVETNPKKYVDSQIAKLTLAIVEKANGVFLWVRLVLIEFLKSSVDGTTLDELHGLLSMMPDELEEFYDMIIRKIPKAYLLESYDMMEVLLRSDRGLSLEQFAGALACASCATSTECMSQLQMKQISGSSRHALKLKIESRCGGLVEILDTEARPGTVQFMHQTVKKFVSKPDFKQRILGNFGISTKQNGHSILAKYYLSASSAQTIYGATVGLGLFHARLSESTTGLSQATFLNSIGATLFNSWVDRELAYVEYRPSTVLALAVTADLRLYVTEEVKRRPIFLQMQPEMSLLHAAVEHTMVNQEQESGHAKVNPMDSLGAMCGILLKLGVSTDSEYRRSTPFASLFEHFWRLFSAGSITSPSQRMFDIAQAFLSAGQNPDVDIFRSLLKEGKSCKPLHILHSRFVALLLQHKAAVNALDSSGRTALDLSIAHCDLRKPLFSITDTDEAADGRFQRAANGFTRRADEAFESTMLLIENGGCITIYGAKRLQRFLSKLGEFYPIPDKFKNIPRLQGFVVDPLPLRSILKVKTSHIGSQTVPDVPNKSKNVVPSAPSRPQVFSQQSYDPIPHFSRFNQLWKAFKRSKRVSEIQTLAKDVAENPAKEVEERPTEKSAKSPKTSIPGHYRSTSQPYRTKTSRASGQEDVAEASKAELLGEFGETSTTTHRMDVETDPWND